MQVHIENRTAGEIKYHDLKAVMRMINKQIRYHFEIVWNIRAEKRRGEQLVYHKSSEYSPNKYIDTIIWLVDTVKHADCMRASVTPNALNGVPFSVLSLNYIEQMELPWEVALSQEVLETILDPVNMRFVIGPHPVEKRNVFYSMNICQPVRGMSYVLNGIRVANFVTPRYYNINPVLRYSAETRYMRDFLRSDSLKPLGSIGGGASLFYDPVEKRAVFWRETGEIAGPVRYKELAWREGNLNRFVRWVRMIENTVRGRTMYGGTNKPERYSKTSSGR